MNKIICEFQIRHRQRRHWLDKFVVRGTSRPTGQLLMTLNEAIAESFSYKRRTSRGTQTPRETIERQEGTCRDFALLMMEAARLLGFAARFVTVICTCPVAMVRPAWEEAQRTHGARSMFPAPAGWSSIPPMALSVTVT